MDFGDAIRTLKLGKQVTRQGWNGKGMYLFMAVAGEGDSADGHHHTLQPFIIMRTAQGTYVPWLASQTDVLAEDWVSGG